jgi:hypothetical protein
LFLQAKEAQRSVFEPHAGASSFRNHGRRVVEGQWLMQAASDSFLGWCAGVGGRRAGSRLLRPPALGREGLERHRVDGPSGMGVYAQLCGWTLARAHARSSDSVAIGAYLGSGGAFDEAIAGFSDAYADQNDRDHASLLAAIVSGRLEAEGA